MPSTSFSRLVIISCTGAVGEVYGTRCPLKIVPLGNRPLGDLPLAATGSKALNSAPRSFPVIFISFEIVYELKSPRFRAATRSGVGLSLSRTLVSWTRL